MVKQNYAINDVLNVDASKAVNVEALLNAKDEPFRKILHELSYDFYKAAIDNPDMVEHNFSCVEIFDNVLEMEKALKLIKSYFIYNFTELEITPTSMSLISPISSVNVDVERQGDMDVNEFLIKIKVITSKGE